MGNPPLWNKGKGKGYAWLVAHVNYQGDDCLKWPFCTDPKPAPYGGRGMLQHLGRKGWAHRWMCELAKGPPPTPKHKACHSCGNGHLGCVNPKHLDWKTQAHNLADAREHGTYPRHHHGGSGKLTMDLARYVRDMRGVKTQSALAAELEVSEGAINDIWRGRKWNADRKMNYWSPEDDATALAMTAQRIGRDEIGAALGRTGPAVERRLARIARRQTELCIRHRCEDQK